MQKLEKERRRKRYSYLLTNEVKQGQKIRDLQKCAKLKFAMAIVPNIDGIIAGLPEYQKLVVKTWFETARKATRGKQYTKDWIYTCLLIKIKNPTLYRHLRSRELLPLPSPSTFSNYIRNFDSSYGFQTQLFKTLNEKKILSGNVMRR